MPPGSSVRNEFHVTGPLMRPPGPRRDRAGDCRVAVLIGSHLNRGVPRAAFPAGYTPGHPGRTWSDLARTSSLPAACKTASRSMAVMATPKQPASAAPTDPDDEPVDRKSTRLNSSHLGISY